MKKILTIKDVKKLSRTEQKSINGAGTSITCCGNNRCRISYPGGSFCEPGRCLSWGGCILY